MADKSIQCGLDEILITSGAQQGIYLAANLWFRQNASLMVEKFVYPGFLQVANLFNLNYLGIPSVFGVGPDLNYMETILKKEKPLPFLYTVCNGNNPQSETWSHELRKNIALLAEKYNFIVVEDDPYGYLSFTEEKFLPMRAYTKNALYIGSFSKIIAPSLRVGWMVGDKEIIQKLEQLKDMNNLSVSNLNQLTVNKFLERHELAMITQPQINLYKEKRDCMIAAIKEYLKIPFKLVCPKHGMFIWLEFPCHDIEKFQKFIFEKSRVLYIPGSAFSVVKSVDKQAIRLNFSFPTCAMIVLGIKKLSACLNLLETKKISKIDI